VSQQRHDGHQYRHHGHGERDGRKIRMFPRVFSVFVQFVEFFAQGVVSPVVVAALLAASH
jgi:hypothetical protein